MAEFGVGSLTIDGSDLTDQGDWYPHKSMGSKPFSRDLLTLHNVWTSPAQMLQLAPGHLWCSCCGDVRPKTYFDATAWSEEGEPTAWAKECKQCMNARDPRNRPTCFCSGCKQEKRREAFGDDERNASGKKSICKDCTAKAEHQRRERKAAEQGRELRAYQWAR